MAHGVGVFGGQASSQSSTVSKSEYVDGYIRRNEHIPFSITPDPIRGKNGTITLSINNLHQDLNIKIERLGIEPRTIIIGQNSNIAKARQSDNEQIEFKDVKYGEYFQVTVYRDAYVSQKVKITPSWPFALETEARIVEGKLKIAADLTNIPTSAKATLLLARANGTKQEASLVDGGFELNQVGLSDVVRFVYEDDVIGKVIVPIKAKAEASVDEEQLRSDLVRAGLDANKIKIEEGALNDFYIQEKKGLDVYLQANSDKNIYDYVDDNRDLIDSIFEKLNKKIALDAYETVFMIDLLTIGGKISKERLLTSGLRALPADILEHIANNGVIDFTETSIVFDSNKLTELSKAFDKIITKFSAIETLFNEPTLTLVYKYLENKQERIVFEPRDAYETVFKTNNHGGFFSEQSRDMVSEIADFYSQNKGVMAFLKSQNIELKDCNDADLEQYLQENVSQWRNPVFIIDMMQYKEIFDLTFFKDFKEVKNTEIIIADIAKVFELYHSMPKSKHLVYRNIAERFIKAGSSVSFFGCALNGYEELKKSMPKIEDIKLDNVFDLLDFIDSRSSFIDNPYFHLFIVELVHTKKGEDLSILDNQLNYLAKGIWNPKLIVKIYSRLYEDAIDVNGIDFSTIDVSKLDIKKLNIPRFLQSMSDPQLLQKEIDSDPATAPLKTALVCASEGDISKLNALLKKNPATAGLSIALILVCTQDSYLYDSFIDSLPAEQKSHLLKAVSLIKLQFVSDYDALVNSEEQGLFVVAFSELAGEQRFSYVGDDVSDSIDFARQLYIMAHGENDNFRTYIDSFVGNGIPVDINEKLQECKQMLLDVAGDSKAEAIIKERISFFENFQKVNSCNEFSFFTWEGVSETVNTKLEKEILAKYAGSGAKLYQMFSGTSFYDALVLKADELGVDPEKILLAYIEKYNESTQSDSEKIDVSTLFNYIKKGTASSEKLSSSFSNLLSLVSPSSENFFDAIYESDLEEIVTKNNLKEAELIDYTASYLDLYKIRPLVFLNLIYQLEILQLPEGAIVLNNYITKDQINSLLAIIEDKNSQSQLKNIINPEKLKELLTYLQANQINETQVKDNKELSGLLSSLFMSGISFDVLTKTFSKMPDNMVAWFEGRLGDPNKFSGSAMKDEMLRSLGGTVSDRKLFDYSEKGFNQLLEDFEKEFKDDKDHFFQVHTYLKTAYIDKKIKGYLQSKISIENKPWLQSRVDSFVDGLSSSSISANKPYDSSMLSWPTLGKLRLLYLKEQGSPVALEYDKMVRLFKTTKDPQEKAKIELWLLKFFHGDSIEVKGESIKNNGTDKVYSLDVFDAGFLSWFLKSFFEVDITKEGWQESVSGNSFKENLKKIIVKVGLYRTQDYFDVKGKRYSLDQMANSIVQGLMQLQSSGNESLLLSQKNDTEETAAAKSAIFYFLSFVDSNLAKQNTPFLDLTVEQIKSSFSPFLDEQITQFVEQYYTLRWLTPDRSLAGLLTSDFQSKAVTQEQKVQFEIFQLSVPTGKLNDKVVDLMVDVVREKLNNLESRSGLEINVALVRKYLDHWQKLKEKYKGDSKYGADKFFALYPDKVTEHEKTLYVFKLHQLLALVNGEAKESTGIFVNKNGGQVTEDRKGLLSRAGSEVLRQSTLKNLGKNIVDLGKNWFIPSSENMTLTPSDSFGMDMLQNSLGVDLSFWLLSYKFALDKPIDVLSNSFRTLFTSNPALMTDFDSQLEFIIGFDSEKNELKDIEDITDKSVFENLGTVATNITEMQLGIYMFTHNSLMFLGMLGVFEDLENPSMKIKLRGLIKFWFAQSYLMPKHGESFKDSWWGRTLKLGGGQPLFKVLLNSWLDPMLTPILNHRQQLNNISKDNSALLKIFKPLQASTSSYSSKSNGLITDLVKGGFIKRDQSTGIFTIEDKAGLFKYLDKNNPGLKSLLERSNQFKSEVIDNYFQNERLNVFWGKIVGTFGELDHKNRFFVDQENNKQLAAFIKSEFHDLPERELKKLINIFTVKGNGVKMVKDISNSLAEKGFILSPSDKSGLSKGVGKVFNSGLDQSGSISLWGFSDFLRKTVEAEDSKGKNGFFNDTWSGVKRTLAATIDVQLLHMRLFYGPDGFAEQTQKHIDQLGKKPRHEQRWWEKATGKGVADIPHLGVIFKGKYNPLRPLSFIGTIGHMTKYREKLNNYSAWQLLYEVKKYKDITQLGLNRLSMEYKTGRDSMEIRSEVDRLKEQITTLEATSAQIEKALFESLSSYGKARGPQGNFEAQVKQAISEVSFREGAYTPEVLSPYTAKEFMTVLADTEKYLTDLSEKHGSIIVKREGQWFMKIMSAAPEGSQEKEVPITAISYGDIRVAAPSFEFRNNPGAAVNGVALLLPLGFKLNENIDAMTKLVNHMGTNTFELDPSMKSIIVNSNTTLIRDLSSQIIRNINEEAKLINPSASTDKALPDPLRSFSDDQLKVLGDIFNREDFAKFVYWLSKKQSETKEEDFKKVELNDYVRSYHLTEKYADIGATDFRKAADLLHEITAKFIVYVRDTNEGEHSKVAIAEMKSVRQAEIAAYIDMRTLGFNEQEKKLFKTFIDTKLDVYLEAKYETLKMEKELYDSLVEEIRKDSILKDKVSAGLLSGYNEDNLRGLLYLKESEFQGITALKANQFEANKTIVKNYFADLRTNHPEFITKSGVLDIDKLKDDAKYQKMTRLAIRVFEFAFSSSYEVKDNNHMGHKPFINQAMTCYLSAMQKNLVANINPGGGKTDMLAGMAYLRHLLGYKTVLGVSNPTDLSSGEASTKILFKKLDMHVGVFREDDGDAKGRSAFANNDVVYVTNSSFMFRILRDRLDPRKSVLPYNSSETISYSIDESDKNFVFDGSNPAIMSNGSEKKLTGDNKELFRYAVLAMEKFLEVAKKEEDGKYYNNINGEVSYTVEGEKMFHSIMSGLMSGKTLTEGIKDFIKPGYSSETIKARFTKTIISMQKNLLNAALNVRYGTDYIIIGDRIRLINMGMRRVDWQSVQKEHHQIVEAFHVFGSIGDIGERRKEHPLAGISESAFSSTSVTARETAEENVAALLAVSGTNLDIENMYATMLYHQIPMEDHVKQSVKIVGEFMCLDMKTQLEKVVVSAVFKVLEGKAVVVHIPIGNQNPTDKQLTIDMAQKQTALLLLYIKCMVDGNDPTTNKDFQEKIGAYNKEYQGIYDKTKTYFEFNVIKKYYDALEKNFGGADALKSKVVTAEKFNSALGFKEFGMYCIKEYTEGGPEQKQLDDYMKAGRLGILFTTNTNRAVDLQPRNDDWYRNLHARFGYGDKVLSAIMTEYKRDMAFWIQEALRVGRANGPGREQGEVTAICSAEDKAFKQDSTAVSLLRSLCSLSKDTPVIMMSAGGFLGFPPNARYHLPYGDFAERIDTNEKQLLDSLLDRVIVDGKYNASSVKKNTGFVVELYNGEILTDANKKILLEADKKNKNNENKKKITKTDLLLELNNFFTKDGYVLEKAVKNAINEILTSRGLPKLEVIEAQDKTTAGIEDENTKTDGIKNDQAKKKEIIRTLVLESIKKEDLEKLTKKFITDTIKNKDNYSDVVKIFTTAELQGRLSESLVAKMTEEEQKAFNALPEPQRQTELAKMFNGLIPADKQVVISEVLKIAGPLFWEEQFQGSGLRAIELKAQRYEATKFFLSVDAMTKEQALLFIKYGLTDGEVPDDVKLNPDFIEMRKIASEASITMQTMIRNNIQHKHREGVMSNRQSQEQQTTRQLAVTAALKILTKGQKGWRTSNSVYRTRDISELGKVNDMPTLLTMMFDKALSVYMNEFIKDNRLTGEWYKNPEQLESFTAFILKKTGINLKMPATEGLVSQQHFSSVITQSFYSTMLDKPDFDIDKISDIVKNRLSFYNAKISEMEDYLKFVEGTSKLVGASAGSVRDLSAMAGMLAFEDACCSLFEGRPQTINTLNDLLRFVGKATMLDRLLISQSEHSVHKAEGVEVVDSTPKEHKQLPSFLIGKKFGKSPEVDVKISEESKVSLYEDTVQRALESKLPGIMIEGIKYDFSLREDNPIEGETIKGIYSLNAKLRELAMGEVGGANNKPAQLISDDGKYVFRRVKIEPATVGDKEIRLVSFDKEGIVLYGDTGFFGGVYQADTRFFGDDSKTEIMLDVKSLEQWSDGLVKNSKAGGTSTSGEYAKMIVDIVRATNPEIKNDELSVKVLEVLKEVVLFHEKGHVVDFLKGLGIEGFGENKFLHDLAEISALFPAKDGKLDEGSGLGVIISKLKDKSPEKQKEGILFLNAQLYYYSKDKKSVEYMLLSQSLKEAGDMFEVGFQIKPDSLVKLIASLNRNADFIIKTTSKYRGIVYEANVLGILNAKLLDASQKQFNRITGSTDSKEYYSGGNINKMEASQGIASSRESSPDVSVKPSSVPIVIDNRDIEKIKYHLEQREMVGDTRVKLNSPYEAEIKVTVDQANSIKTAKVQLQNSLSKVEAAVTEIGITGGEQKAFMTQLISEVRLTDDLSLLATKLGLKGVKEQDLNSLKDGVLSLDKQYSEIFTKANFSMGAKVLPGLGAYSGFPMTLIYDVVDRALSQDLSTGSVKVPLVVVEGTPAELNSLLFDYKLGISPLFVRNRLSVDNSDIQVGLARFLQQRVDNSKLFGEESPLSYYCAASSESGTGLLSVDVNSPFSHGFFMTDNGIVKIPQDKIRTVYYLIQQGMLQQMKIAGVENGPDVFLIDSQIKAIINRAIGSADLDVKEAKFLKGYFTDIVMNDDFRLTIDTLQKFKVQVDPNKFFAEFYREYNTEFMKSSQDGDITPEKLKAFAIKSAQNGEMTPEGLKTLFYKSDGSFDKVRFERFMVRVTGEGGKTVFGVGLSALGADVLENVFQAMFVMLTVAGVKLTKGEDMSFAAIWEYGWNELVVTSSLIKRTWAARALGYKYRSTSAALVMSLAWSQVRSVATARDNVIGGLVKMGMEEGVQGYKRAAFDRLMTSDVEGLTQTVNENQQVVFEYKGDSLDIEGLKAFYKQTTGKDVAAELEFESSRGVFTDNEFDFLNFSDITDVPKKLISILLERGYLEKADKGYVVSRTLIDDLKTKKVKMEELLSEVYGSDLSDLVLNSKQWVCGEQKLLSVFTEKEIDKLIELGYISKIGTTLIRGGSEFSTQYLLNPKKINDILTVKGVIVTNETGQVIGFDAELLSQQDNVFGLGDSGVNDRLMSFLNEMSEGIPNRLAKNLVERFSQNDFAKNLCNTWARSLDKKRLDAVYLKDWKATNEDLYKYLTENRAIYMYVSEAVVALSSKESVLEGINPQELFGYISMSKEELMGAMLGKDFSKEVSQKLLEFRDLQENVSSETGRIMGENKKKTHTLEQVIYGTEEKDGIVGINEMIKKLSKGRIVDALNLEVIKKGARENYLMSKLYGEVMKPRFTQPNLKQIKDYLALKVPADVLSSDKYMSITTIEEMMTFLEANINLIFDFGEYFSSKQLKSAHTFLYAVARHYEETKLLEEYEGEDKPFRIYVYFRDEMNDIQSTNEVELDGYARQMAGSDYGVGKGLGQTAVSLPAFMIANNYGHRAAAAYLTRKTGGDVAELFSIRFGIKHPFSKANLAGHYLPMGIASLAYILASASLDWTYEQEWARPYMDVVYRDVLAPMASNVAFLYPLLPSTWTTEAIKLLGYDITSLDHMEQGWGKRFALLGIDTGLAMGDFAAMHFGRKGLERMGLWQSSGVYNLTATQRLTGIARARFVSASVKVSEDVVKAAKFISADALSDSQKMLVDQMKARNYEDIKFLPRGKKIVYKDNGAYHQIDSKSAQSINTGFIEKQGQASLDDIVREAGGGIFLDIKKVGVDKFQITLADGTIRPVSMKEIKATLKNKKGDLDNLFFKNDKTGKPRLNKGAIAALMTMLTVKGLIEEGLKNGLSADYVSNVLKSTMNDGAKIGTYAGTEILLSKLGVKGAMRGSGVYAVGKAGSSAIIAVSYATVAAAVIVELGNYVMENHEELNFLSDKHSGYAQARAWEGFAYTGVKAGATTYGAIWLGSFAAGATAATLGTGGAALVGIAAGVAVYVVVEGTEWLAYEQTGWREADDRGYMKAEFFHQTAQQTTLNFDLGVGGVFRSADGANDVRNDELQSLIEKQYPGIKDFSKWFSVVNNNHNVWSILKELNIDLVNIEDLYDLDPNLFFEIYGKVQELIASKDITPENFKQRTKIQVKLVNSELFVGAYADYEVTLSFNSGKPEPIKATYRKQLPFQVRDVIGDESTLEEIALLGSIVVNGKEAHSIPLRSLEFEGFVWENGKPEKSGIEFMYYLLKINQKLYGEEKFLKGIKRYSGSHDGFMVFYNKLMDIIQNGDREDMIGEISKASFWSGEKKNKEYFYLMNRILYMLYVKNKQDSGALVETKDLDLYPMELQQSVLADYKRETSVKSIDSIADLNGIIRHGFETYRDSVIPMEMGAVDLSQYGPVIDYRDFLGLAGSLPGNSKMEGIQRNKNVGGNKEGLSLLDNYFRYEEGSLGSNNARTTNTPTAVSVPGSVAFAPDLPANEFVVSSDELKSFMIENEFIIEAPTNSGVYIPNPVKTSVMFKEQYIRRFLPISVIKDVFNENRFMMDAVSGGLKPIMNPEVFSIYFPELSKEMAVQIFKGLFEVGIINKAYDIIGDIENVDRIKGLSDSDKVRLKQFLERTTDDYQMEIFLSSLPSSNRNEIETSWNNIISQELNRIYGYYNRSQKAMSLPVRETVVKYASAKRNSDVSLNAQMSTQQFIQERDSGIKAFVASRQKDYENGDEFKVLYYEYAGNNHRKNYSGGFRPAAISQDFRAKHIKQFYDSKGVINLTNIVKDYLTPIQRVRFFDKLKKDMPEVFGSMTVQPESLGMTGGDVGRRERFSISWVDFEKHFPKEKSKEDFFMQFLVDETYSELAFKYGGEIDLHNIPQQEKSLLAIYLNKHHSSERKHYFHSVTPTVLKEIYLDYKRLDE